MALVLLDWLFVRSALRVLARFVWTLDLSSMSYGLVGFTGVLSCESGKKLRVGEQEME